MCDTSTRESASAGDAVKPVLCPIGGCRSGYGSSVCSDDEDALSKSLPSVYEDNSGDDANMVVMLTDHQVWWLIISLRKIRVCKVMLC